MIMWMSIISQNWTHLFSIRSVLSKKYLVIIYRLKRNADQGKSNTYFKPVVKNITEITKENWVYIKTLYEERI